MTMKIIGAGMAGLLAANMLKRRGPTIIESQASLPNNHSAILRFASMRVGDACGIPFRPVRMTKTYLPWQNKIADSLAYSAKCSGVIRSDRSITKEALSEERWIAPSDLIARMAEDVQISFSNNFFLDPARAAHSGPIISTMPMPTLMDALGYDKKGINFNWIHGANLRATIPNCDAYVSLYVPNPGLPFNRISVSGDELIVEFALTPEFPMTFEQLSAENQIKRHLQIVIYDCLGLGSKFLPTNGFMTRQKYAKIQPIDETARKQFLSWATDNFNIFSLGRFATWRPGLLLDDLVQDVQRIEKWAFADRYSMRFRR